MNIEHFFDPETSTLTYLLADMATRECAIVDSVLNFDPKSGRTSTRSADLIIQRVRAQALSVAWILETHLHADHLSAAPYLKQVLGGRTGVGARITEVQRSLGRLFNAGTQFSVDGRQFDRLFMDGELMQVGGIRVRALHTPGHTPACVTYVASDAFEQAAFVGDTLFMPDFGTARCDFPGGDARTLFHSIQRVLALPDDTSLYMCHDYQPGGRELRFRCSVAEMRAHNIHVKTGTTQAQFVALRQARDAALAMPALLFPSVQVNMRGGELPPPEANGGRYLKIPLNAF